jgi:serine protease Do
MFLSFLSRNPARAAKLVKREAKIRAAAFSLCLALSLAVSPLAFADPITPGTVALPSFAPIVKQVLPAVVNISVTQQANAALGDDDGDDQQAGPNQGMPQGFPPSPFDDFLRRFFQQQQQQGQGFAVPRGQSVALGSGFIIDPAGYIVTNNHVVDHADKVTVIFQDGTRHPAKVIGRDPKTDLALIKIDAKDPLPYVSWGDSSQAQVGDWVLAVGNPFGLGGTVSTGIISARSRDIHEGPYDDFLQIDASINRGNSGGPDFNLNGQVVGINTAIYSPNGGSVGIGFAIPSSMAKPVIEQLRASGKVQRGWIGVQIQDVTPDIAKNLGLPSASGALVADVTAGGPAEKAGFKQGDVILSYNGQAIAKVRDLPIAVAQTPVGQKAEIKLWRQGSQLTLDPVIAAMPDTQAIAKADAPSQGGGNAPVQTSRALGLKLAPLTPDLRRQAGVPADVKGVIVTGVADDSPLADIGVQPGDVIVAVNQQPAGSPQDLAAKFDALSKDKSGNKTLLLLINRRGINQYVALSFSGNDNG